MAPILLSIPYPDIDPVAFHIFWFPIRWYALAYMAGLLLGYLYCIRLARIGPIKLPDTIIEDLLVWVTLGVVLGGRTGYVLFYRPAFFIENPIEIPQLWHGGMSFHGGCAGVLLAILLFSRKNKISYFVISDIVACAVPIGLFFGRLANFANGELWGRVTDVPWGMIFPGGGPEPRHPSQLYQASLEGIVLFAILLTAERMGARKRPGLISGLFLVGYAVARTTGELFREPDAQLHFLVVALGGVTMGQLLSVPMALAGLWLISRAKPIGTTQPA